MTVDLLAANEKLFLLNQKLIAENRKLREALEFYANDNNWKGKQVIISGMQLWEVKIESDGGKIARKALEVKK